MIHDQVFHWYTSPPLTVPLDLFLVVVFHFVQRHFLPSFLLTLHHELECLLPYPPLVFRHPSLLES